MGGITRLNGSAVPEGFYGLQPTFLRITIATAKLNMHTGFSAVDSNYEKVVKAVQTVGSIVLAGEPAADSSNSVVVFMVDGASLNAGAGAVTSGAYGALKDAIGDIDGTVAPADVTVAALTKFQGGVLA